MNMGTCGNQTTPATHLAAKLGTVEERCMQLQLVARTDWSPSVPIRTVNGVDLVGPP